MIGLSGYYSKDMILEQAFSFWQMNQSIWGSFFFVAAAGGAAITAFYMFRLWFMTFAGQPRDQQSLRACSRIAQGHDRSVDHPGGVCHWCRLDTPFSSLNLPGLARASSPRGHRGYHIR